MKNHDQVTKVKHFKSKKNFKENIEFIWAFMKDFKSTSCEFKNFISPLIFIKGDNCYEIGSEFTLIWKNFLTLYIRTEEIEESTNFKKLAFLVYKTEPKNFQLRLIFNLHKVTYDNSTLLNWEIVYPNEEREIKLTTYEKLKLDCMDFLNSFEEILNTKSSVVRQTESTQIKCDAKRLWKVLTQWQVLKKIAPTICDELECDNEILTVGDQIKLKFYKNKLECILKVISMESTERKFILKLFCGESSPKISNQDLIFEVFKINENNCFIVFTHCFHEFQTSGSMEKLAQLKKECLSSLKGFFDSNKI
jgi:hypothetical protein